MRVHGQEGRGWEEAITQSAFVLHSRVVPSGLGMRLAPNICRPGLELPITFLLISPVLSLDSTCHNLPLHGDAEEDDEV